MQPGHIVIRRSAYQRRESDAAPVEHVERVTPTGRIRLRSGALENPDGWRHATPAEIAAWRAHEEAVRRAAAVRAHLEAPPPVRTAYRPHMSPRDIATAADMAAEWNDKLAERRYKLADALRAADAALEACQPPRALDPAKEEP